LTKVDGLELNFHGFAAYYKRAVLLSWLYLILEQFYAAKLGSLGLFDTDSSLQS
jgi:hypothetical protein